MTAAWKQGKEKNFLIFLSGYHLLFTILTWNYFAEKGGDAAYYWFVSKASASKSFADFQWYGSDIILLLNYPFAKLLELDIRVGFLLYSFVGLVGILQFYKLCKIYLHGKFRYKGIEFYLLLLFLPNLHYWTAMLGKEAFCFLFITTILLQLSKKKYSSFALLFSVIFLILIRPHIALMLLFSVLLMCLLFEDRSMKTKLLLSGASLILSLGLFYMFLQLSEIKRFDWSRIQRFNEFSLLSFKGSDTYVPIIDYPYPYKVFTFYFRPLVNEIPTFYGTVLGMENMILLLLHLVALVFFLRNYKKLIFPFVLKIILCFALVSGVLIVQRYSGFGIFARTKIMLQPFVALVLLWIIAEVRNKKSAPTQ